MRITDGAGRVSVPLARPLESCVGLDGIAREVLFQPHPLDDGIKGRQRQREERADQAANFRSDGTRQDDGGFERRRRPPYTRGPM